MGRKDRRGHHIIDTLPERMLFRDDGCDLFRSCLHCPLPRCRYDDPGWRSREVRARRHEEARDLLRVLPLPDVARRVGYSERTVYRIQAGA